MTNTTPARPRRVTPRYVDPRVIRQMAEHLRDTQKITGDIEGALREVIEKRKISPTIEYEDLQAPVQQSGNIRVEVGDLIAWSFKLNGTGRGSVCEVKSIVTRNSHLPRVYPHWGRDEVIVVSLSTGKERQATIGRHERKVRLV